MYLGASMNGGRNGQDSVASGYRSNAIAGLDEKETLVKGIHGVAIYLKRAMMVPPGDHRSTIRAGHLADADRLLSFLTVICDQKSTMGLVLVRCYSAIQRLIAAALMDSERGETHLTAAYEQARALESVIGDTITSDSPEKQRVISR